MPGKADGGAYLNFFLNRENFARRTLESVLASGGRWGAGEEGRGKTICLDFSSINIAKRFHIGHLSTTMIGQSLRRIFDFLGYKRSPSTIWATGARSSAN